jgi:hypothetical protein
VTLTSTVKLDCVLETLVWSIVIDRLHAVAGVVVGVGVGVRVAIGVGVGVGGGGVGVGVGVRGVGVGVGVAIGVAVGVGVGVDVPQFSLPIAINVPGELWLLYSVATQAWERAPAAT